MHMHMHSSNVHNTTPPPSLAPPALYLRLPHHTRTYFQTPGVTRECIEEVVDAIQASAITSIDDLIPLNPKVVCLRNKARVLIDRTLAICRANFLDRRMYVWAAVDHLTNKMPITDEVRKTVLDLTPDKLNGLPGYGYFFVDAEYTFVDNNASDLCRFRNNHCVAVAIVLHHLEPPDDTSKPFRMLRYVPEGILVKPDGAEPNVTHGSLPPNCLVIRPVSITIKKLKLPDGSRTSVSRRTIPLAGGYAVTDFFAQGMSFKEACWLMHLTPPPSGGLKRQSMLVSLTRYPRWTAVKVRPHADRAPPVVHT